MKTMLFSFNFTSGLRKYEKNSNICRSAPLKRFCFLFIPAQVDLHIMTQPPSGEWVYFNTEVTNSSGRVSFVIPEDKRLGIGVYPVKMVVR